MKRKLRQYVRSQRVLRNREELNEESERIVSALLAHPRIVESDSIMTFYSMPDEVCTHRLVDELVGMGKTVFLPKVVSDTKMTIHRYTSREDMAVGAFGIMEPVTPSIELKDLPAPLVCITPGMAFDAQCNRLGRGKGYYDRFFSAMNTLLRDVYKIGVCFSFQFVDNVPSESTDVRMDEVISSPLPTSPPKGEE